MTHAARTAVGIGVVLGGLLFIFWYVASGSECERRGGAWVPDWLGVPSCVERR